MPFTPFHLGPALFLGLALSVAFDLPALLVASVIPDVEPFCVMYFRVSGYGLHGFLHSYLGSSVLAVSGGIVVYLFGDLLNRVMAAFRISRNSSFKKILFTSFAGVYSHVFLDSFLYGEMDPFYPLQGNPFPDVLSAYGSYSVVYGFCSIAFILGFILYLYGIKQSKPQS